MLTIFVAVMMHKAIMAFSLGLNIAQSSFSVSFFVSSWPRFIPNMKYQKVKAFVLSSLLFSLASPFGVGVGIKTTSLSQFSHFILFPGIGLSGLPASIPQRICNGILQVCRNLIWYLFVQLQCIRHLVNLNDLIITFGQKESISFCLQGIAGGTFLYITFFEVSSIFVFLIVDMEKDKAHLLADELTETNSLSQVLPSELNVPENRLLKVFPGNKIKGLTQAAPFNQCPFQ